jgi:hypothetical protein
MLDNNRHLDYYIIYQRIYLSVTKQTVFADDFEIKLATAVVMKRKGKECSSAYLKPYPWYAKISLLVVFSFSNIYSANF